MTGNKATGLVQRHKGLRSLNRRFACICALAVACICATVQAQNSEVTVTVNDLNGVPIPFATVCMSLNNTSMGSRLTDNNGNATLTHLAVGDYTMYIFKGGFETKAKQQTIAAGSQTRIIALAAGTSTPPPAGIVCNAGSAFTIPNPKITKFEIEVLSKSSLFPISKKTAAISGDSTTNPNVRLIAEFDRAPSFFRVGEVHNLDHPEQELRNLPWQPYTPGMVFNFRLNTTEPYGTKFVFMQINAGTSESGASPAKGDGVVYAPTHTKTFTLTGQSLQQFIQRAMTLGYRFVLNGPVDTGNYPCPNGTIVDPQSVLGVATNTAPDYTETWSGKIFDRTEGFLNPFWKMTSIEIQDVFNPANPLDVSVGGPFSGRVDDPFRTVGFKRGFVFPHPLIPHVPGLGPDPAPGFSCVVRNPGPEIPPIKSITLEGPDDKQAVDALFQLPN